MAERLHRVNRETCRGDGICVEVCPEQVLEIAQGTAATVEKRAGACIDCGQCVAVCPTESLRMPSLPMEGFPRLGRQPVGYEALLEFLRHRRSVRVFQDRQRCVSP
jgi:ferredoxin